MLLLTICLFSENNSYCLLTVCIFWKHCCLLNFAPSVRPPAGQYCFAPLFSYPDYRMACGEITALWHISLCLKLIKPFNFCCRFSHLCRCLTCLSVHASTVSTPYQLHMPKTIISVIHFCYRVYIGVSFWKCLDRPQLCKEGQPLE